MVGSSNFGYEHPRGEAKETELRFGNIGVILCGDFAHLRRIGQKTLIAPISAESSRVAAKLGHAGRRIVDAFRECAKFRVIYRQGAPCPLKRLRVDYAIAP